MTVKDRERWTSTPRVNTECLDELIAILDNGCGRCDFEESDGSLICHCDSCCRKVTVLTYELLRQPPN
jgi:hypothetical protein